MAEPDNPEIRAVIERYMRAFEAAGLQVFTVIGGLVVRNVVFADPRVFEIFGLPDRIPSDEFRSAASTPL